MQAFWLQGRPPVQHLDRAQFYSTTHLYPFGAQQPRFVARAQNSDEHSSHDSVQDGLVSILQLEIAKKRMKELSDSEKQAFMDAAREGIDQDMQQLQSSAAAKSAKDYDKLLGQLTSSVDELSRALEQSKEATKAGQLEFEEWKKDMTKRRSESLFFKSLYRDKQGKPKRLVDKLGVLAYPEVTEVRERLKARAQMGSEEQQEQFQLNIAYIYAATSAVLCIGLVNGLLQSADGGRWQTALYGIFAVAFGASSWLSFRKYSNKSQ